MMVMTEGQFEQIAERAELFAEYGDTRALSADDVRCLVNELALMRRDHDHHVARIRQLTEQRDRYRAELALERVTRTGDPR